MIRKIRFDNFTGGLNTVSALGTINQSPNRTETPDCQNVEYFLLGGLKHMDGNTLIGQKFVNVKVTGGFEYRFNNIRYMIISLEDGRLLEFNKSTNLFELIYTFATPTDKCSGVAFGNGMVFSNGEDDLLYYEKNRDTLLTGSVSGTAGTTTITGVNTLFSTELHVGEFIKIGTHTYRVTNIPTDSTKDTVCTVTPAFEETFTSSTYSLTPISLCNATLVNTDDSSVSKPIRGIALNVYRGRLFVGGNDSNLYYSELNNFHGWDIKYGAGAFDPFYNDTSDIYALGLYGDNLVIHRQSFSYVLGGENTPDSWTISPFADISCESQQSFVATNNAYYVYSRKNGGIYPLMKRNMFSDRFVGDELSVKVRNLFELLDTSNLDKIFAVSFPLKRWMIMYMPFINGTGSNVAMVYDFQTGSWLRRVVPQEVTCAFKYNDKVYIGTAKGEVLEEFNGLTFDGKKIPFYWKSPWYDFNDGSTNSSVREFRIQIAEDYNVDFYVRNKRDGLEPYNQRRIKNKSGLKESLVWSDEEGLLTDTVWDGSELDPPIEGQEWSDGGFTTYRFPLATSFFQQMQIILAGNMENTESDTTQGMAVYGYELHGIDKEETPW